MLLSLIISSVLHAAPFHDRSYDTRKAEARVQLLRDLNEHGWEYADQNSFRYTALSEMEVMRTKVAWQLARNQREAELSLQKLDVDLASKGPGWCLEYWYIYTGLAPDRVFKKIDDARRRQLQQTESALWCQARFE